MCELTSDFVTCHVCKSSRQFNYRTKADAIVRRSSPSVLCVWICAVCTGRWDDFSTFAVRYPRENPARDGFNPDSLVIFCFHSLINPFFIHFCIRFAIDRIPDELDTLDSNRALFFIFPGNGLSAGLRAVYFAKPKWNLITLPRVSFVLRATFIWHDDDARVYYRL